jgi:hypothetical protein
MDNVRPLGGAGQDERDDQTGDPHHHEDDTHRGSRLAPGYAQTLRMDLAREHLDRLGPVDDLRDAAETFTAFADSARQRQQLGMTADARARPAGRLRPVNDRTLTTVHTSLGHTALPSRVRPRRPTRDDADAPFLLSAQPPPPVPRHDRGPARSVARPPLVVVTLWAGDVSTIRLPGHRLRRALRTAVSPDRRPVGAHRHSGTLK